MKLNLKIFFAAILSVVLIHPILASQGIYHLSYEVDLSLAGAGAAAQIGSYLLGKHQDPLTINDIQSLSRSDVNSFDRPATYNWSESSSRWSDYTVAALVASPAVLLAAEEPRNDALVLGIMYLESIVLEDGFTGIAKSAAGRKRPYVYNPDVPSDKKTDKDAVRSFWSGHTSTAFNSAVFLSVVFSDYYPQSPLRYAVWSGSLITASATGYLRYRAGRHYPSDIIAGAVMGSLTGYIVPALHRAKGDVSIIPYAGLDSSGVVVVYRF